MQCCWPVALTLTGHQPLSHWFIWPFSLKSTANPHTTVVTSSHFSTTRGLKDWVRIWLYFALGKSSLQGYGFSGPQFFGSLFDIHSSRAYHSFPTVPTYSSASERDLAYASIIMPVPFLCKDRNNVLALSVKTQPSLPSDFQLPLGS